MGIRLPDPADDLPVNHAINVTPFIDVMLVLLIVFMVAAPLATVDVKVDLPESTAAAAARPQHPVTLTLRGDGTMLVNDRAVAPDDLGPVIAGATGEDREERIHLMADKTITYDAIMQAMNALRRAGYHHVTLVGAEGTGR